MFLTLSFIQSDVSIDPTGTYETKQNVDNKGNDLGNQGFLSVKYLGNSKIKIQLEYYGRNTKYGPNMGQMDEVLELIGNKAIYASKEYGYCKIEFTFDSKGVKVEMIGESSDFSCGFGVGVYVDGYYYKTSSKSPKFRED